MSLKSKIESLLFVSNYPLSFKKLADITGEKKETIKTAAEELVNYYKDKKDSGIHLLTLGEKIQLVSSPENAKVVQNFIKDETTGELTRAQLETLTIIAYRGPITKAELEKIRGVNCSVILRNLHIRGLIEARESKAKMEKSYNITLDFIKYLDISEAKELPDYEKLSTSDKIEEILKE